MSVNKSLIYLMEIDWLDRQWKIVRQKDKLIAHAVGIIIIIIVIISIIPNRIINKQ